ncbi:hypothetical protein [Spirochaeta thermophila]|uniref:Uncharacterized protein n=1 Tax=Winmispira thermophila (strain ATCC 49972 / DSM 6192 / RI 19.B1) TaxID=665571 RepID=E0RU82_WINT6|nr:hypothetical protein [Spirochaeta thermophila]ADN02303.1 hypothetical protein STHERM_c13630 [Spirochaeta thermophila DSM 6192]
MKRWIGALAGMLVCLGGVWATDWKSITTPHFEIIFPAELEKDAQYTANLLEHHLEDILGIRPEGPARRWPVVLWNTTMTANGSVGIAPAVSYWYEVPYVYGGQFAGEWYSLLAVHEGRHMAQVDAARQGPWWLYYLLGGEAGEALHTGLTLPMWFMEGDAVWAETAYSDRGRGRVPGFASQFRALTLEHPLSYHRMVNRSYKVYTPTHYVLGYHLVSYIRETYGEEAIQEAIRWGSILPYVGFDIGLRRATGKGVKGLYNEMLSHYRDLWKEELATIPQFPSRTVVPEEADFTWYAAVRARRDGSLLLARATLEEGMRLVVRSAEGEKRTVGEIPFREPVALSDTSAYWVEYSPGQGAWEGWADLWYMDIATGTKRRLTTRGRYYGVGLSDDGTVLVGLWFSRSRDAQLQVFLLDRPGSLPPAPFFSYTFPHGEVPSEVAVSPDKETLAVVVHSPAGVSLQLLHIPTATRTTLIPPQPLPLTCPLYRAEALYFIAPLHGYPAIYAAFPQPDGPPRLFLTATAPYDITALSIAGDTLYYAAHTSWRGHSIQAVALTPSSRLPAEEAPHIPLAPTPQAPSTPFATTALIHMEQTTYPVKDYSVLGHLLNIHSWLILPLDLAHPHPEETLFNTASLTLFSTDLLGTADLALSAAYTFPTRTAHGVWTFDTTYLGLAGEYLLEGVPGTLTTTHLATARLPIQGGHGTGLNATRWVLRPALTAGITTSPEEGTHYPVEETLSFVFSRTGGPRDPIPLWGLTAELSHLHHPLQGQAPYLLSETLELRTPGLLPHAGLTIEAHAAQGTHDLDGEPFALGYRPDEDTQGILSITSTYTVPFLSPDLAPLGSPIYLRRMRLAGIYSAGWQAPAPRLPDLTTPPAQSAGCGLVTDMGLFDIPSLVFSLTTGLYWPFPPHGDGRPRLWLDVDLGFLLM